MLLSSFHPQVVLDRRTESGKAGTAERCRLWTSLRGQDATGDTASRDRIRKVILRSQALDPALYSGEDGADLAEILCRRQTAASHILQTDFQLLADGQGAQLLALRRHRRVVGHAGHEQPKSAAEDEAADAGHADLEGARVLEGARCSLDFLLRLEVFGGDAGGRGSGGSGCRKGETGERHDCWSCCCFILTPMMMV